MGNERPGGGWLNSTNGVEEEEMSVASSSRRLLGRRRSRSSRVPKRGHRTGKLLLSIQSPPFHPSVRPPRSFLYTNGDLLAPPFLWSFPLFPSQLVPVGSPSSFFTTPVRMPVSGCGFIYALLTWTPGCWCRCQCISINYSARTYIPV
jgi:hypothetical protein